MAAEHCPNCCEPFLSFYIEDRTKPVRLANICCPYCGHVVRAETSFRTYVTKQVADRWHLANTTHCSKKEEKA